MRCRWLRLNLKFPGSQYTWQSGSQATPRSPQCQLHEQDMQGFPNTCQLWISPSQIKIPYYSHSCYTKVCFNFSTFGFLGKMSNLESRSLLDEFRGFDKGGFFDLGHPLLNRIAESFLKAAGVSNQLTSDNYIYFLFQSSTYFWV